jgi:glyoxylase-like metal-dependent hydrolase (beta-lactamase superfamily II)
VKIDGSGTLRASCLLCPNPGPMTLEGTNTWVLREPGAREVVVVDPGPQHERHLERVARSVQEQGSRVELILLTHGHDDHSGGARYFSELTGAPVRAADARLNIGEEQEALHDGEHIVVGGLELQVLAVPGHTADSVAFHLTAEDVVLTGDTILGYGTTVIEEDGLADYLASLERLLDTVTRTGVRALLPAHGPLRTDPQATLEAYLQHRQERLDQIRAAVAAGDRTPEQVVARVYSDIDRSLVAPALSSVRAQLRYLTDRGEIPTESASFEE